MTKRGPYRRCRRTGSVLIIALWTLSILSIFALYLGIGVRQKITLLSRLAQRDRLHLIAEAGVKKAIAVLHNEVVVPRDGNSAGIAKMSRYNNPAQFASVSLGGGAFDVSYRHTDGTLAGADQRFGIADEASKININTVEKRILIALIRDVLGWQNARAKKLAEAIIDWREVGESELTGFYSESFYENLQHPYPMKNENFEAVDELLLVKGMDSEIFERLRPFITVYGNGRININTASSVVLRAVGVPAALTKKIMAARRGVDGIEATADDFIFTKTYDIASDLRGLAHLEPKEILIIDELNGLSTFETNSSVYSVVSHGRLSRQGSTLTVTCIFDTTQNAVVYWQERYTGHDS